MDPPPPRFRGVDLPPHGLVNPSHANRCFVDALVQALRYVRPFSSRITSATPHQCSKVEAQVAKGAWWGGGGAAPACITCEMALLLAHLTHCDDVQEVDTRRLRWGLALHSNGKFAAAREMGDSADALTVLLGKVHGEFQVQRPRTGPTRCACPVHEAFEMRFRHMGRCTGCGVVSTFMAETEMFVKQASLSAVMGGEESVEAELARFWIPVSRTCPRCDRPGVPVIEIMTKMPKFLVMEWVREDNVDPDQLNMFWGLLARQMIDLNVAFRLYQPKPRWARVQSMVCYYGHHYVSVAYNKGEWLLLDDHQVRVVGKSFADVAREAMRSRYVPALMFWEVLPEFFVFRLA